MTQPNPTILALVSAPLVDLYDEPADPLDADRELAILESWLHAAGRAVELTVEWAETARLQQALLGRRFDLLHYTGHGSPGALAFEDGRGGLHALPADHLVGLVCPGGQPAFRLAFLSTCHSARLATALLAAGVPHVVAVDEAEPVMDLAADQETSSKDVLISLAEAARRYGFSQDYLSLLARKGRLKAVKIARNWLTIPANVEECIRSRQRRGRYRDDIQA